MIITSWLFFINCFIPCVCGCVCVCEYRFAPLSLHWHMPPIPHWNAVKLADQAAHQMYKSSNCNLNCGAFDDIGCIAYRSFWMKPYNTSQYSICGYSGYTITMKSCQHEGSGIILSLWSVISIHWNQQNFYTFFFSPKNLHIIQHHIDIQIWISYSNSAMHFC